MRAALKGAALALATACVLPAWCSFALRGMLMGRDRALEGSTQLLSLVPGVTGQYLRKAFLRLTLDHCASSVTVEFGTIFSRTNARLDEHVYLGPRCHVGSVHLERNVLVAAGVHLPSGPDTHGTDDVSTPIRDQPGRMKMIRVGAGSWIGSAAVILADVGANSIVAAGAVVTRDVPPGVVAAGVPARVLRSRTGVAE